MDARYIGNDTAGDYSSSSATQYSVTENSDDTTTTISGATTVVFKQKVTYTATIAAVSPGSGAPVDGHVTFSIDGGAGPTVLVANGIATDVVTWGNPADGNMHTVDATYLGDDTLADFNSSMATTYNVTENSDDTITTITTSSGNFTPVTNETVTYTATISAINNGAGAPVDGTVTFHILGVNSFIPLHNGVATTTVTWGAAGTVDNAFRATYDGNDSAVDYKGSISTTHSITVGKDSTTTTLAPSDANPGVGENVTWTATLSATPPGASSPIAPTGNVSFTFDGGTATLSALTGNTATFSGGALTLGHHTVTAMYVGDGNFKGSSPVSSSTVNVTQTATTTTISYSPSNGHVAPNFFGLGVTISATVTPNVGSGTPTGTVNFLDNAGATTLASSVSLTGGVATFSTSSLTAGNHTIVAVYSGDPNFIHSNSTPTVNTILVITPAVTKTVAGFAGTVTVHTTAAAHATSLTVLAIGGNLPSGASITFGAVTVTLSQAALAGATTLHVNDIGATGIPATTVSSSLLFASNTQVYSAANFIITALVSTIPGEGAGIPTAGSVVFTDVLVTNASSSGTFQSGGKTTLTIGLVKVGAGGKATLNESLNGGLVLPGVITAFFSNGQPGNISPLPSFIFAQYVNGLAGGTSDSNFFASANPSSSAQDTISRDQTLTTLSTTPPSTTGGQVGLPVTITGVVTALGVPGGGGPWRRLSAR